MIGGGLDIVQPLSRCWTVAVHIISKVINRTKFMYHVVSLNIFAFLEGQGMRSCGSLTLYLDKGSVKPSVQ